MFVFTRRHPWMPALLVAAVCCMDPAEAQLTDLTQTPNAENAGIFKSLQQQIGAGVGNLTTPVLRSTSSPAIPPAPSGAAGNCSSASSRFCRASVPAPTTASATSHTSGAIGAGLIESCAGCHGRPRGSAGFGGDVVTRPDSRDAPHLFGLGLQEMLADEITTDLRNTRRDVVGEATTRRDDRHASAAQQGHQLRHDHAPTPRAVVDTTGSSA